MPREENQENSRAVRVTWPTPGAKVLRWEEEVWLGDGGRGGGGARSKNSDIIPTTQVRLHQRF